MALGPSLARMELALIRIIETARHKVKRQNYVVSRERQANVTSNGKDAKPHVGTNRLLEKEDIENGAEDNHGGPDELVNTDRGVQF